MQDDALMSSAYIYRTLVQGFGMLYQEVHGVTVRLESIEGVLQSINDATTGQNELTRVLRELQLRTEEHVGLLESASGAEALREDLRLALREVAGEGGGNQARHIPFALTQRPVVKKFVGRTQELDEVRELLEREPVVAIRADGGVGKTALAAAIVGELVSTAARGQTPLYDYVAWVCYTGDVAGDLAALEVPGSNVATSDERIQAVKAWLHTTSERTLLVIDNMDERPCQEEEDLLLSLSPCVRVLMTTRVALDFAEEYSLELLCEDQALQMLYTYFLDSRRPLTIEDIELRKDYSTAREIVRAADKNALLVELISRAAQSEGGALRRTGHRMGMICSMATRLH